jgi:hypothetical protein
LCIYALTITRSGIIYILNAAEACRQAYNIGTETSMEGEVAVKAFDRAASTVLAPVQHMYRRARLRVVGGYAVKAR